MTALITLLSTAVPTVLTALPTDVILLTAPPPVSTKLTGVGIGWNVTADKNLTRQDLAVRYGGGGIYAVLNGLLLSAGAGLSLNIAAGYAACDGILYFPGTVPTILTNATPWSYIWLLRTGIISVKLSTGGTPLLPPDPHAVYLGAAKTAGGAITQIDYAGVCRVRGGITYRETADLGAPLDTPPAVVQFIGKTLAGTYLWDGLLYQPLGFVPVVTADPGGAAVGTVWYRSDLNQMSIQLAGGVKRSAAYT